MDVKQILGRANVKPLSGTLSKHYVPASTLSRGRRVVRRAQMPFFYAISYVWGEQDKTRSHEIIIEGNMLPITENLYNGLRAMQKQAEGYIYVWRRNLHMSRRLGRKVSADSAAA